MRSHLTLEQNAILLTSRISLSKNDIDDLTNIVCSKKFNWFEFSKLTLYHKTLTLSWFNLKKYVKKIYIPKYLNDICRASYKYIEEKNHQYQNEINNVIEFLKKNKIVCIPVKGAILINKVYENYGIRYSGDADFLVKYSDIEQLEEVLFKLDYVNGKYNMSSKTIESITRNEKIKWKMYMSNLYPFLKLNDSELFPFFKLDFRYALDDKLNKEPVNEIIDTFIKQKYVANCHYLIHLCTHFYNEAKHTASIRSGKDLSMIKMCDIREYILQFMDEISLMETVEFAIKYDLRKQIYFTMFFLKNIYNDGYEKKVMNSIGITDSTFIHTFGDNTIKDNSKYNKGVWDRLFSCNNADELVDMPRLFREN